MELKPFQRAILTVDLTAEGLTAGDVGTVVDLHNVSGIAETGYNIEFYDMAGNTVAVVSVAENILRHYD